MKSKLKNRMMAIYKGQKRVVDLLSMVYGLWSIVLLLTLGGCSNKNTISQEYTCPMHPTVIQDKPGTCPICGMDLVLKGKLGKEVKITPELRYLLKPTNELVIASIKTVVPIAKAMNVSTEVQGVITYDTRRISTIPVRVGGRIEKLFVTYNFQPIRKGQKVLEIYSAELVTAQRELLYLLNSDSENSVLIESAKEKLTLLGATSAQINELIRTKKESYSFSVYSPVDGYVVEETTLTATSLPKTESASGGMNGGSSMSEQPSTPTPLSTALQTREGMYLSSGQSIFKVVNTEQVWAEFKMSQKDASLIKVNDRVTIQINNTTHAETVGTVYFIEPFYQEGESFITIRVNVVNPKNTYVIGQFVLGNFITATNKSKWIPREAQLDLGMQKIAFVKQQNVFKPIVIQTGRESGNWIEVLVGLESTDSIAYNAQFLMDSESFIKVTN